MVKKGGTHEKPPNPLKGGVDLEKQGREVPPWEGRDGGLKKG